MNNSILTRKKDTVNKVSLALSNATAPLNDYYNFFPEDIKAGLISFKERSIDIKSAYFICASKVINSISHVESYLSSLPSLMIDADRLGDTHTVLFCDQVLLEFGELRKALNTFTAQSEKILSTVPPSYSGLITVLSEFRVKLNKFIQYIKALEC
ncbi:MAG: hypothetical protein E7607_01855 [Ruminococcaceae bacterium]|nr:hypothetical protein [Oscillospiraceae bacterium]